jgi:exopolysaccharide production protein ExoQ
VPVQEDMAAIGRRRALDFAQAAIPVLALAYPLLIQPLMTFRFHQAPDADAGLDLQANARAGSNAVNQMFWIGLIAAAALVYRDALSRARALSVRPAFLLVLLYLTLCMASVLWSPVPQVAGKRAALQLLVVLATVAGASLARDRALVLRGMAWLFAAAVAINLPLTLVMPAGRLGGALGIYGNKNILGLAMALAAMFTGHAAVASRGAAERPLMIAALLGSLAALVRSESETSLLLALLAPALAVGIMACSRLVHVRLMPVIAVATLWVICLAAVYVAAGGSRDAFATLVFGDATFSGRTQIWQFVSDATVGRELLGIGYASFWGAGQGSYVAELAPGFIAGLNQAHNGYLDVLIETGAAGVLLLVAVIVSGLRAVDSRPPDLGRGRKTLLIAVMLFVVLHNLLESSWFRNFSIVWVTYLLTLGLALHRGPASRRGAATALDHRGYAYRQRAGGNIV